MDLINQFIENYKKKIKFYDRLSPCLYVIIGVTIFCKLTITEKDADYEN